MHPSGKKRKRKVILWGDDMTNGEKYGDEIRKLLETDVDDDIEFCDEFIGPKILRKTSCSNLTCGRCILLQSLWLNEEYKEPEVEEVDWSKVPVDTKIFVKSHMTGMWAPRHFAKYEDGTVATFENGRTSFTVGTAGLEYWEFAKLAEVDDEKS